MDTIDTTNYADLPLCTVGGSTGRLDAQNNQKLIPFLPGAEYTAEVFAKRHGGKVAIDQDNFPFAVIPLT